MNNGYSGIPFTPYKSEDEFRKDYEKIWKPIKEEVSEDGLGDPRDAEPSEYEMFQEELDSFFDEHQTLGSLYNATTDNRVSNFVKDHWKGILAAGVGAGLAIGGGAAIYDHYQDDSTSSQNTPHQPVITAAEPEDFNQPVQDEGGFELSTSQTIGLLGGATIYGLVDVLPALDIRNNKFLNSEEFKELSRKEREEVVEEYLGGGPLTYFAKKSKVED